MSRLGTSGFFHGGAELFLNGTLFMRVRCSGIRQWEPLYRSDFLQEFADWKAVYMRVFLPAGIRYFQWVYKTQQRFRFIRGDFVYGFQITVDLCQPWS